MRLECFAVFDSKAEAYLRPWFIENVATALRTFTDAAADDSSPFGQHPEDYTLFHLGSFDMVSGVLDGAPPRAIATALSVRSSVVNAQLRAVGVA